MQRFFTIYALMLCMALPAQAGAQTLDRYGEPMTALLDGGAWWTKEALAPEQTEDKIGQLVQVKGRVVSTYRTREDLYLNFGENYKTDFTVRIPKRAWKQFGELDGKEIIVRGVLREYNGPMIVADFKEQIHAD